MRMGGRLSAAIEVLDEIAERHRPASQALADWGRAHRFAGGGDRAAIGNLVFDALRRHNSLAHRMKSDTSRALVLGVARWVWDLSIDQISTACGEEHGPADLSDDERSHLACAADEAAPDWVKGDYPEWLAPSFTRAFGARAAEEGAALAVRAPVDLRINTLKGTRGKVLASLKKFGVEAGPLSPLAVRIPAPAGDGRTPNVEAEPAHARGWFEVQDAASQVAARMTAVKPGMQVADICAGAGGKTLAMAAMMEGKGQIHAHDADRHRLKPIIDRIRRAGAHNVQVIPADEPERLETLLGRMDVVLVDAPCSGSGSWRRKPDAKWRLTPKTLEARIADQAAVLNSAVPLVKPGGRIVYVTCSVLPEENGDQIAAFLAAHGDFRLLPYGDVWRKALDTEPPASADGNVQTLLLTPLSHGGDGFFIAVMERTVT